MGEGIGVLTADQRQVFEALTIDGVPIDVLAERMQTTRGDVYQTLHTARRVLRERLMRADPSELDVGAESTSSGFACGKRVSNADHPAITMNQNDDYGGRQ